MGFQLYEQNKRAAATELLDAMTKLAKAGETARPAIAGRNSDDGDELDMPGWFDLQDLTEHVGVLELHARAGPRIA
ncbi:hypothetical protein [Amycolatopsis tolypomycina]|uniref:hypothetical protein n=1 Tax=Amycolatopsis tolypomycina TaxID=208445 RepID=UPI00339E4235